jgi:hypothetical protein
VRGSLGLCDVDTDNVDGRTDVADATTDLRLAGGSCVEGVIVDAVEHVSHVGLSGGRAGQFEVAFGEAFDFEIAVRAGRVVDFLSHDTREDVGAGGDDVRQVSGGREVRSRAGVEAFRRGGFVSDSLSRALDCDALVRCDCQISARLSWIGDQRNETALFRAKAGLHVALFVDALL